MGGKKPNPKTNNAVIAARVAEVFRLRLDGAQRHDLCEYSSEKGWGVSTRTIEEYIRRADEILAQRNEADREKLLAFHCAARMTLFSRAVNAADYRTALTILDDEARLRGLYPAAKVDVSADITPAVVEVIVDAEPDAPSVGAPTTPEEPTA